MYATGLAFAGYQPLTASDAETALHLIDTEPPDAVVTDLRLPGSGGWHVIQRLKQNASTRAIPIIVLTGYTDPEIAATARKAGCAAVLTKPCLPEHLVQVLEQLWPRTHRSPHGGRNHAA